MSSDLCCFRLAVTGPFLQADRVNQLSVTVSEPDTINVLTDKVYFISHRVPLHQTTGFLILDL